MTASTAALNAQPATGPFKLITLPYAYNALEPHIDALTMEIHHSRHHAAYVNNLNAAIVGTLVNAGWRIYDGSGKNVPYRDPVQYEEIRYENPQ